MRVLFVTPGEFSAGEAITAIHCSERVIHAGGEVHFLASRFTAAFIESGGITLMNEDPEENRAAWSDTLTRFRPDAVVFADFGMTFFSSGVAPLGNGAWLKSLDNVDAELFTFDHLGFAQGPMNVFYGPPHLGIVEPIQQPPSRVHVLLPCPVQEPNAVEGRRGVPFRYWSPPALDDAAKLAVRTEYAGDGFLIFHSVPTWAWEWAQRFGHPYYDFLSRLLTLYFVQFPRPVTIVSVNNGRLLSPSEHEHVRILNLSSMPKEEYEALILAADLMLTENSISVSLGKAVCGGVPAAVLKNGRFAKDALVEAEPALAAIIEEMEERLPGAVYPYEVFPIWGRRQVEKLGVFKSSSYPGGVAAVEIFGGSATQSSLQKLVCDPETRGSLLANQRAYGDRVAALPQVEEVIANLIRR
jgi:hypothetical protein